MDQPETRPVETERARPAESVAAEPATDRALWPTFMRRTLSEDALRGTEPAVGK